MTEPGVIMVLGAPLGLRGGGKMKTLRLAAVTALVAPLGALVQMKRFSLAALAGAVALLAPLGVATSAQAAAPVPFTITEQINFATGDATFTATGPLCSKGIFADDVKVFAPRPVSLAPSFAVRARSEHLPWSNCIQGYPGPLLASPLAKLAPGAAAVPFQRRV